MAEAQVWVAAAEVGEEEVVVGEVAATRRSA